MKLYLQNKIRSFKDAYQGIISALELENNLFIHFALAFFAVFFAWFFDFDPVEWLIVFLNIGLVISAELFNTAIEKLCDLISKEYDPRIRQIKDVSAAAVLIAAIVAFISGVFLFLPKLYSYLYYLIFN